MDHANCIYLVADSVMVVGGRNDERGVLQWIYLNKSKPERIEHFPKAVQQIGTFNDALVVAIDGHRFHSSQGNGSFAEIYIEKRDWISNEFKGEFSQFLNVGDSVFVGVSRSKLAFGVLIQSYDSLKRWTPRQYENELRCIARNDREIWAGGNGILLKTNLGDTNWQRMDLKNTAIAGLHFESANSGLAVTYRGQLIRTSDGGRSWSSPKGRGSAYVNKCIESNGIIYVLASDGLLGLVQSGHIRWKKLDTNDDFCDMVAWHNQLYIISEQANLFTLSLDALEE